MLVDGWQLQVELVYLTLGRPLIDYNLRAISCSSFRISSLQLDRRRAILHEGCLTNGTLGLAHFTDIVSLVYFSSHLVYVAKRVEHTTNLFLAYHAILLHLMLVADVHVEDFLSDVTIAGWSI